MGGAVSACPARCSRFTNLKVTRVPGATSLTAARRAAYTALACVASTFCVPAISFAQTVVNVGTAAELQNAVSAANSAGGNRIIRLADGTYTLTDTLYVNAPSITITGASGNREAVIVQGDAMSATAKVKNLVRVGASNFTLSNLTLRRSGWHLLQIAGEANADNPKVSNVVFRDAYEQMLKVSIDQNNYASTSDNGIIENSLFEYTAGIGPQYYIGGIDVHGGKNWIVRGNTFRSIISPSQDVAEFAIHFWNQSADALIERNVIINCDRGIGFGLDNRGNSRGIIRNNMIYHSANAGQFHDTGIYLDQSPGTQVYNNTIYMENDYPRAIEYRFSSTSGVLIVNNLTNKPIASRDGATGTVGSNVENAARSWFVNASAGDLHLASAQSGVVDAGRTVSGLTDDIDGTARPQGAGIDIGADEWGSGGSRPNPPTNLRVQ
jgi:hypothetical protein